MTAATLDLTGDYKIEAGDTFDVIVTTDFDTSVPAAWTAPEFRATFRQPGVDGATAVFTLLNITSSAAAAGNTGAYGTKAALGATLRIVISASDTADASFFGGAALTTNRTGWYDFEIYDTTDTNRVKRLLQGAYEVSPEATR